MKKILATLLCLMLAAPAWSANAVYVAQTSAGGNTGADCADAVAATYFNTAGNWSATPTGIQIGPATTVHFCGTITSTMQAQGDGSSGNPVTIIFESGASLQQAFCPASGCFQADSRNWITVDGNNVGLIGSTANGTGLANQQSSAGMEMHPCGNCEVKNLTIQNIYVHSGTSTDGIDATLMRAIYMSGSNFLVHDNTIHDCGWCVYMFYGNGDANESVYNNNIYNMDHGVAPSGFNMVAASNFFVYKNHIHDMLNWDTTGCGAFHHDGVHAFGTSTANLTNLQVYNNEFDGNPGICFTSSVYLEKPDASISLTNALVFNNVIDISAAPMDTFGGIAVGQITTGVGVYNNTIVGENAGANRCILMNGGNTIVENNICTGENTYIYEYGAIPSVTLNYNLYAAIGSTGWQDSMGMNYLTIAAWRTASGQEANSQLVSSAGLNSGYQPNTGSAAIGAGTNLTSLAITALNSDKNGIARPGGATAWAAGAFQFVSPAGFSRGRLP